MLLLLLLHGGHIRLHYLHTRNHLCLNQYPTYGASVLCAAIQAHYMVILSIIKEVHVNLISQVAHMIQRNAVDHIVDRSSKDKIIIYIYKYH